MCDFIPFFIVCRHKYVREYFKLKIINDTMNDRFKSITGLFFGFFTSTLQRKFRTFTQFLIY